VTSGAVYVLLRTRGEKPICAHACYVMGHGSLEMKDRSVWFAKYPGQWVALADDEVTVLAAAPTARAALAASASKGIASPDPVSRTGHTRRRSNRQYAIMASMTKLLEKAIAKVREFPEEDQDAFAIALLSMAGEETPVVHLDDQTRTAVRDGLAQATRGEFVPDEEMETFFKQHDL
jgi:hypothetical protein